MYDQRKPTFNAFDVRLELPGNWVCLDVWNFVCGLMDFGFVDASICG